MKSIGEATSRNRMADPSQHKNSDRIECSVELGAASSRSTKAISSATETAIMVSRVNKVVMNV